MFITIPGWAISAWTFPGVILHEIAHRFFCEIFNIDVYEIHYFRPFSSIAGCVIHKKTENFRHAFFVGVAPLLINTLVCLIALFSIGIQSKLETTFISESTWCDLIFHILTYWIGFSCGFHAIPSNQDIANLLELSELNKKSKVTRGALYCFIKIINFLNMNYLGFYLRLILVVLISHILPSIYLGM